MVVIEFSIQGSNYLTIWAGTRLGLEKRWKNDKSYIWIRNNGSGSVTIKDVSSEIITIIVYSL